MRMIAGALLLIAAAICLGASVIAEKLPQSGSGSEGITYLVAIILGLLGFILLLLGLALDNPAESRPTPRWVWILSLVMVLGPIVLMALMVAWPSSPKLPVNMAPNEPLQPATTKSAEQVQPHIDQ